MAGVTFYVARVYHFAVACDKHALVLYMSTCISSLLVQVFCIGNLPFVFVVFFLAEDLVMLQETSSVKCIYYFPLWHVARFYHFPLWPISHAFA